MGYCTCECDCDCDDTPELSGDGKEAFREAMSDAENLRRGVLPWLVRDAERLLQNLDIVARELGLRSREAVAAENYRALLEKRRREREAAARRAARDKQIADILGCSL